MQVGSRDATTPAKHAIKAVRTARSGTLEVYEAGHFTPYTGEMFEAFVVEQVAFLRSHFSGDAATLAVGS